MVLDQDGKKLPINYLNTLGGMRIDTAIFRNTVMIIEELPYFHKSAFYVL